jgi:hypothetical protein
MRWNMVDGEGNVNHDIYWTFKQDERVKVRVFDTHHVLRVDLAKEKHSERFP